MPAHPAVRVTQMHPGAGQPFVVCLIVGREIEMRGVETLTSRQVDVLIEQLRACQANAKKGN
jgi:hypothetical protein